MSVPVSIPGQASIVLEDAALDAPSTKSALPRRCYAAGHVVMDEEYARIPHSIAHPGASAEIARWIDWDATMALRTRTDSFGMGVAEAMDTAQRFELGWTGARELLRRTGELGLANGFVGAASSDHRAEYAGLDELADGVAWQARFVRECGGLPIVLPQPELPRRGTGEDDYVRFYLRVIDGAGGEVLLHWLGEVFHAGMRGYFPGESVRRILSERRDVVRGIKLSLLDRAFEERLREEIAPHGQVVFTGDDYHFAPLIEGSDQKSIELPPLDGRPLSGGAFSHALLGIFDATVRPASEALRRLDAGDPDGYRALMEPCEALGRAIFEPPVQHYKAGIAFLAWLGGLQGNRMLVNHEENARSVEHYLRIARLASEARVIEDADAAARRLEAFIASAGPIG